MPVLAPVPTPTMRPQQTSSSGASFQKAKALEAYHQALLQQHQGIINQSKVKGASTEYRPPASTGPVYQTDAAVQNVNQNTDSGYDQIDRDYETATSELGYQEQNLRGTAATSLQEAEAGYAPARTAIGEEQATREAGLAKEESTAVKQQSSALQQARDLYRQMTQQNIAQLSGLGISSSSVTEALAEKLGVETARRIAGVTGSTQEVLQNIAQERTRVGTYYKQKLADLEAGLSAAKAKIQNSLVQGLNQINQARNQAATDKANRRAELWRDAQNQIFQIQQKAADAKYALDEWNYKRNQGLEEAKGFVVTPTDFSGLQSAQQGIQGILGQGLGGYTPEYTISPSGKITTTIRKNKEDDLVNQIESAFQ